MATHRILIQQNPDPFDVPVFYQNGFLFNEPVHLQQQSNGPFYLVSALNQITQQAEARCAFFVRSNETVSPIAAPFGSIEFLKTLPESVLDEFLNSLVDVARSTGATTLRIVNYPNCYAPEKAYLLTRHLIKHGFWLCETNQNFFLPITTTPFDHTIAPAERRRLRKCREANFQFAQWESPNVHQVIEFLQQTRQRQGYLLTIQPERLSKLIQELPDQFTVFTVRDGATIIALTVAVRVQDNIVYNFLPASHPDYQTFSPMVMLIKGLVNYCQQQKVRLLDLGVSLDHNRQPKPSLMRFKRNLGAQESPKITFEKQL